MLPFIFSCIYILCIGRTRIHVKNLTFAHTYTHIRWISAIRNFLFYHLLSVMPTVLFHMWHMTCRASSFSLFRALSLYLSAYPCVCIVRVLLLLLLLLTSMCSCVSVCICRYELVIYIYICALCLYIPPLFDGLTNFKLYACVAFFCIFHLSFGFDIARCVYSIAYLNVIHTTKSKAIPFIIAQTVTI